MIAITPSQLSAIPRSPGMPGHVGVKRAVEHARGVLGARQVTTEPEQLLGDPGEHHCCCCCWACSCQPP